MTPPFQIAGKHTSISAPLGRAPLTQPAAAAPKRSPIILDAPTGASRLGAGAGSVPNSAHAAATSETRTARRIRPEDRKIGREPAVAALMPSPRKEEGDTVPPSLTAAQIPRAPPAIPPRAS